MVVWEIAVTNSTTERSLGVQTRRNHTLRAENEPVKGSSCLQSCTVGIKVFVCAWLCEYRSACVCVCVVCEAVLGFQISSEKHGASPPRVQHLPRATANPLKTWQFVYFFPLSMTTHNNFPAPGNMAICMCVTWKVFPILYYRSFLVLTDELIQYRELHPSAFLTCQMIYKYK